MALTVNAKTYTFDGGTQNAASYYGPAKTVTVKDDIRISRVLAKPTAAFSGVARQATKLTRTHTLTGAVTTTGDSISEISHSFPVGTAAADIDTACADLGALIASAAYKTLIKAQVIST